MDESFVILEAILVSLVELTKLRLNESVFFKIDESFVVLEAIQLVLLN
jgi:hypothetical protein